MTTILRAFFCLFLTSTEVLQPILSGKEPQTLAVECGSPASGTEASKSPRAAFATGGSGTNVLNTHGEVRLLLVLQL